MATEPLDFVHKFVPAAGSSRRTLVLLHGTGGDEADLLPLGQGLDPDAALLGVRGKVMEGPMPRFFRRLAEGVFDEADIIFRTHELAAFLAAATDEYHLDPTQLVAVGYSNGANIAASLMLLNPTVLSDAVLLRAMVPLVPASLPDLAGHHILMAAGRQDPIIPADNAAQLSELLQQAGADVALHWSDASHGLLQSEVELARRWLAAR